MDVDRPKDRDRGTGSDARSRTSDPVERWRTVEELFYRALEEKPASMESFLDEAAGGDVALRREVASLLAAHEAAGSRIEELVQSTAAEMVGPDGDRRIGAYRLLREIGHGGMGVVWLAERADGAYEHRVAIKLVKRHVASAEALRRFLNERQILARLEHPAIARLLDGGATEDGTPYLVLEYVDGEPIDAWCRRCEPSIEERLHLFLEICDAVESAHRQLVVHRDLKPSNLLVDTEGRPRLLDFGVAKLLDDDDGAGPTATVERRLTPGYASPEQVLGQPITTASDVYSLGAVLYELLAGVPPFPVAEMTPVRLLDAVCNETPPRPSVAASRSQPVGEAEPPRSGDRRLGRRLDGELDAVVMTALRKEPERRYPSVAKLAEDLRRHLDGRPVTAHSERWSYLVAKWIGRHRLAVGAALVALASLVAGLAVATKGLVEARRANLRLVTANEETAREAEKLEAVNEFLIEMLSASDPDAEGASVKVVDLLGPARRRLPKAFADQPEVGTALAETLGRAYRSLELLDDSEEVLRQGREKAVAALGSASPQALRLERALASTLFERERFEEAAELLSAGRARREAAFGPDHEETLRAQLLLAELQGLLGEEEEAESTIRRVIDLRTSTLGPDHEETLEAVHALAVRLQVSGREAEATPLFRRVAEGRRKLHDPTDRDSVYRLAEALTFLSGNLVGRGRLEEGRELRQEVLDRMTRVRARPERIAQALNNLGVAWEFEGRFEEAAGLYRKALDALTDVGPDYPLRLALLMNLGDALRAAGRLPEAIAAYREAAGGRTRTLGPEHSLTQWTRVRLASALARSGECAEALRIFRETRPERLDGDSLLPELPRVQPVFHAVAFFRCGEDAAAEERLRPAVDGMLATAGPESYYTRQAIGGVAELFEERGEPERAAEYRSLLEPSSPEDS